MPETQQSPAPASNPPVPAPEVIAHRGDPVGFVENTLPAVRAAVAAGARLVEVDVRCTADGAVVLLHDATTRRIWSDPRPVAQQTLAEVTDLRPAPGTGSEDATIPTLTEALRAAAPARLLIDLPDAPTAVAAVASVREVLSDPGSHVPAPAWCGSLAGLEAVRAEDATAQIWLTWDREELPSRVLVARLAPFSWNPEHVQVTPSRVTAMRELGLATTCWTVDDPGRARELAAVGVQGIISNRAAEVRAAVTGGAR